MSAGTGRGNTEEITIPTLQVADLYQHRSRRDGARLKAYNQLLEQIYNRVRVAARLPTHPAFVSFVIPPFILGVPKLDLEDCVVYLVYQLRQSGFMVRYTYPNLLVISWKHHERQYLVNDNPILQAMMATAPAPPPAPAPVAKSKRGARSVRFAEGNPAEAQNTLLPARPQPLFFEGTIGRQTGGPAVRSAEDYEPPTSFFNAVERPLAEGTSEKPKFSDLINF